MGLCILKDEAAEVEIVLINAQDKTQKPVPNFRAQLKGLAFLLVLSLWIWVGSVAAAELKEIAVISSKSFSADALTLEEVKEIYRGERQIIGGVRLKPIDQRDSQPIRAGFLGKVMNFSSDEYVTYWNNRLFREGGIPPIPKNNSAEVIGAVQDTDGAIGYVWLDEATAAKANLKILLTIPVR